MQIIKIASCDPLPLEKTLTLHNNVLIVIKSVFNKNQNHYYCNKFIEKYSDELAKNSYNK